MSPPGPIIMIGKSKQLFTFTDLCGGHCMYTWHIYRPKLKNPKTKFGPINYPLEEHLHQWW